MIRDHDNLCKSYGGRIFLKKTGFLTILFMMAALPGLGCSMANSETNRGPLVGGPCEYRSYPGQAEIVSVTPVAGERFDVKFHFIPDGTVEEPLGKSALERTFPLLSDGEMPPDRAFIEKFDIRPGTRLVCTLRVITRGTCTPILFEFPVAAPVEGPPR